MSDCQQDNRARTGTWKFEVTGTGTGYVIRDGEVYIAEPATMRDGELIVACVNGCAGLNPSAYRECVEALRVIRNECPVMPHPAFSDQAYELLKNIRTLAQHALAHAIDNNNSVCVKCHRALHRNTHAEQQP